ncbi:MAG TPA: exodeoxyribonuclease VII small subunit [Bacteroidales bacterium]|nr:exodeoxyribonuclease VII small subunit [Bacteroidales bacterium]HRZ47797.1 exodeoxyribonuclease VII small subunit [Bacteroidales bacterium]
MTKETKPRYQEAFAELERIVREIESEAVDVDQLAAKVKRASELIKICREKLTATEADVQEILKEINKDA